MKRILFAAFMLLAAFCAAFGQNDGLKVRFVGTGAADWTKPNGNGEYRRLTSLLVDDAVLIDFTPSDADNLPEDCHPKVIFYTHSHGDHYNVAAGLKLGLETVYCSDTWAARCRADYERAAAEMGLKAPEVIGLAQQQEVTVCGVTFKALPGNHYTGDFCEQALIYLLIKGDRRVLYATDTAGIPANAAAGGRFGIDGVPKAERIPLTGFIMESTVGMGGEENFRLFSHSCVETVLHTVHVLQSNGTYKPAPGQPAYLTHLARTLHGTQAELDASLPAPLKAAYDGLEVIF